MITIPPYVRSPYPSIEGNDRVYFDQEFQKIEKVIRTLIEKLDELEERIVALEP